jgi:2,4-dienoyl-CoA reductase (NADPH2)
MAPPRRWRVLSDLREHGAVLRTGVRVLSVEADAVVCTASAGAEAPERVPADSVILAVGTETDARLAGEIAARGREVHRLGDCDEVGYLQGAMLSAARLARQI